ncbi:MAG: hypothetical protein JWO38_5062 [Gemmataceae bacterium]|nr:hypothetical protein [Gemmataceae bacterium]
MENRTSDVTTPGDEKTPEQIEQEMLETRESITEKVAALETQVLGNIQSVTCGVTEAVQSVKEAVATAPTAVSDTVKQTVDAVKETVRETVGSFSVTGCVRDNPWAALGTTTMAGFLAGYFLPGRRGGLFSRPIMARGHDVPAPTGHPSQAPSPYTASGPALADGVVKPGLIGSLFGMVGDEVRQLAGQALSTAVASLKKSISTQIPQVVDSAVHAATERVTGAGEGDSECAPRAGGPTYAAAAPPPRS